MRRTGWLALAGIGAIAFALTALGGTYAVGLALADGAWLDALGGGGFTALTLVFWKWITLGARVRANPPDPDDPTAPEPVGPWGVVGQVLMVLVVATFVAVVVVANVADRSATEAAEDVRDDALRAARRAQLSVEAVEQARSADASPPEQRAGAAVAGLLDVADARIVDSSIDDGRAALLVRPDAGAPCVVVSVDANGILSSALTNDC